MIPQLKESSMLSRSLKESVTKIIHREETNVLENICLISSKRRQDLKIYRTRTKSHRENMSYREGSAKHQEFQMRKFRVLSTYFYLSWSM